MDVFNPKILDACIRDVASCLTDNQKADLLFYSAPSIRIDSYTRVIVENAMQSCLQIPKLSSEKIAKARILRARCRIAAGMHLSANEDLQAALAVEPDNPEATALLYQRSVTVEKARAALGTSPQRKRLSNEIWTEIISYLQRRDLKTLLFVPHLISRIASQLLFKELDLHFGAISTSDNDVDLRHRSPSLAEEDTRYARRTADILSHIIVDHKFATGIRTLTIYALTEDKNGTMVFQIGILTNALLRLTNLRDVRIFASSTCIATISRVLNVTCPRLRGLSLYSSDCPTDLSFATFKHLAQFLYHAEGGSAAIVSKIIAQNSSLQTLSIRNKNWTLPSNTIAIRNLTRIDFSGHLPMKSQALADILTHGRQLECLTLGLNVDCASSSQVFRSMPRALPFLRHFAFTVHGVSSRIRDLDLFPSIAEFLRGRQQLQKLCLNAYDGDVQHIVGFDAALWGVLPSLLQLRTLEISYPSDLSPGLAAWLIPRNVRALTLTLNTLNSHMRDPSAFLDQLRPGVPPDLQYIGLTQIPVRNVALIVERGFPMVRVVRVGNNYWTVQRHKRVDLAGGYHDNMVLEMEQWPRRRAIYNAAEWLEWLGCEDALVSAQDSIFRG
ncbi:hypothetical protein JOM56_007571 [Amanita muscaria]